MPIEKQSLNNFLPNGFETLNQEGYKENFNEEKIKTGYEKDVPDIVSGPNLNNLLDVLGKNTNVLTKFMDFIKNMPINNLFTVDENNQLVYKNIDEVGGSGLEVCDIGMALYVDETKGLRRYLNGQIVDINANTQAFLDRLKQITTLHPSLLCTEDEWQTAKTMSVFGQVGKFVFNYADDGTTVISVRIPRVVNIQGLFDLQNLGMTVAESLPNIKGTIDNVLTWIGPSASGAFVANQQANQPAAGTASTIFAKFSFNASRSSSTYQDGSHVQPEAIQYPYFIQIATGSETENNIVNDIELNNPYSLFDSKYSDHELNNLSWLKSEGQWNAKAVYPDAYDKLLKVYNGTETVEGLSVKLSTEEYTDYDFVLNTANETFRLPLKILHTDNTVDSLSLYYYVGETVQNANLIDAGRIGEVLPTKTDKVQAAKASMPSNKYIDLTLGATMTTYTAPADGWVSCNCQVVQNTAGDTMFFAIYNHSNETGDMKWFTNTYNLEYKGMIPVRKGDTFGIGYNATRVFIDTWEKGLRFYYAEGEQ